MDVCIYINGLLRTDLRLISLRRSYIRPWEAVLLWPGRHDAAGLPRLNDEVVVTDCTPSGATTTTTALPGITGNVLFRGDIVELSPGGVAREGARFTAKGRRFRLENEPVRVNGRGHYIWNRRGHQCNSESGEDSPGKDGGKWTAGEIAVDILEHALGIPAGGSAISGHHSAASCVTDTYLTADDIAGYDASDWLALDTVVGEFSVNNTPVAQALDMLVGLNGGFYGWYVDPDDILRLVNLDACPVQNLEAGEFGHWQDEAGTDYVLQDNRLDWSLDGVYTTVIVQGADRTTEERPANIEGSGNPCLGDCGELELLTAPWKGYACAYRPVAQPKRRFSFREIDGAGGYTPPVGYLTWDHKPRIYIGTDAGAKSVYRPTPPLRHPIWNRTTGLIMFWEVPSLGAGEKLWAWYFACVPFTVQAGPDGDAYWHYGYERTLVIYDSAFKHPTSWPTPGTSDDETAMQILARRLLDQRKDVRRQGTFVCDGADPHQYGLDTRYNILNLGPTTTTATGTTTTAGPTTSTLPPDPTDWDRLQINAVEVRYDFERDSTEITVANTFFMLEGYSEMKRRLEQNLFAQRELALSEDMNDCQYVSASSQTDYAEDVQPTTTTLAPTTTTTCLQTVGTTAETEAEQTDDWDRSSGCQVEVTMLTRFAYNHAGDQKLYAYYRDFVYDAQGALVSVSAETRVTIDTPESCP